MIDQIFVMQSSGIVLFQWEYQHVESDDPSGDNQLVAGFLTALNMFAVSHKKQTIQELTLKETTFLFDREQELIFVVSTLKKEIIPVVKLVLHDLKMRFLEVFPEKTTPMNGDITIFRKFTPELLSILKTYNILPLFKLEATFDTDEDLIANLLLDRIKGDILFIHSKNYLDRSLLKFQTEMIFRASQRLIREKLSDDINEIIALTKNNRSLHLLVDTKTILISEFQARSPSKINFVNLKQKQVQKRIRSPGKLLFDYENDFTIVNHNGETAVTNIKNPLMVVNDLGIEILSIRNSFETIFKEVYKNDLFATLIIGDRYLYLFFPLLDHTAFIFIEINQCGDLPNLLLRTERFQRIEIPSTSASHVHCIFEKIIQFQSMF